ncbi:hypothetical protein IU449_06765 [Nocardia higoensis]|uniref:Endonuclease/exonuclease/phosphatase domain-containing protein n=1 Tax=Nocardia higoensis TaxID=228599 RepID=A0ABS0D8U8_9NOCA|nr:endonuclease/exonuclease/phosphatase family protein [Nocardia higoensis]MBF6354243.1 hypothetical protein [Nocardia higoensis]
MKVKVDLGELQGLLTEVRRAQSSLDHGIQLFSVPTPMAIDFGDIWGVPTGPVWLGNTTPFGNTTAGKALASAHQSVYRAGTDMLQAFSETVDSDGERMELALLLYRAMDDDNAEEILQNNRNNLKVLSTHLTEHEDGHVQDQAEQINRLLERVGGPTDGNVIIGGDFNANADSDSPSTDALDRYTDQGLDPTAGRIDDGLGGTSPSYRPIDYVIPRGVGTSEAERWNRDESDHDGQSVDVTMPAW